MRGGRVCMLTARQCVGGVSVAAPGPLPSHSPHPKHWLSGVYASCTDSSPPSGATRPSAAAGCSGELQGLTRWPSRSSCSQLEGPEGALASLRDELLLALP